MIRKSIIVMLLGFSVLAMSMPVVAQQRAAVDYVVTSTTSGKGVLVIENRVGMPFHDLFNNRTGGACACREARQ